MKTRLATMLVRLYPRRWRERYAQEMLELLTTRPVAMAQLVDIGLAVMRERARQFALVLFLPVAWGGGALLAALGLALAVALRHQFGSLPLFQPILTPSAEGIIRSPAPIDAWGLLPPIVSMLVIARAVTAGYLGLKLPRLYLASVGKIELLCWVVVLFVTSTLFQLIQLGSPYRDAGSPFYSPEAVWFPSALRVIVALQFLASSTRWYADHMERLQAEAAPRARPPQIILGLNT